MSNFFLYRTGFTHKYTFEKCASCGERFPHSIALILLVDLTHGNFLIGPKICLHLLVFERHITLTSLTSAIFLQSLGSGLAVTTFVFDK